MLRTVQEAVRQKHGAELAKVERWSRFRGPETTEEWLELLGPTAIVLSHQEHLVRLSAEILGDSLDPETFLKFCLAMAVHDIGEAVNGDIAAPDKTSRDEKKENKAALRLIQELPHADQALEAYRQVVAGENAALHTLFKAVERTEYFLTGLHLFEQLKQRESREPRLWQMVAKILAFDLPKVLEYAQLFPDTIGRYVFERKELVDKMFERAAWVVDESFSANYDQAAKLWSGATKLAQ